MKKLKVFCYAIAMMMAVGTFTACSGDDPTTEIITPDPTSDPEPEPEPIPDPTKQGVAVDLGLSVKWADRNVGALYAEMGGCLYAWGETTTKSSYTEENSKWHGNKDLKSQGVVNSDKVLMPDYDAATANWGNDWRMPTKEEMDELVSRCTWTWTTQNDVTGYKVTGPNGNSIFLPATEGETYRPYGNYWSSSNYSSAFSCGLTISKNEKVVNKWDYICWGQSIRPVVRDDSAPSLTPAWAVGTWRLDDDDCTCSILTIGYNGTGTLKEYSGEKASSYSSNVLFYLSTEKMTIEYDNKSFTYNFKRYEYGGEVGSIELTGEDNKKLSWGKIDEWVEFETSGKINGYDYVDLGLSVKWSVCNLGVSTPILYGNIYAWGETKAHPGNWLYDCEWEGLTSEELLAKGIIDPKGNLTAKYDVASIKRGGTWRMPTEAELEELIDKCTWEVVRINGKLGYKVTGPNGKSLFLCSTWRKTTDGYWTSTYDTEDTDWAICLDFDVIKEDYSVTSYNISNGLAIRPVSK